MAMGFKPGAKQRAILLAKGSESGDTELLAEGASEPSLRVCLVQAGRIAQIYPADVDNVSTAANALLVRGALHAFDGTNWNRFRNNTEITLLASATRNSDTTSPYQTNYNARGVVIYLNVTAVPGTDTITLGVNAVDPVSGNVAKLHAFSAISDVGFYRYIVYPGCTDTPSDVAGKISMPLPRKWYVHIFHSGSGDFTYSVGASYIL